MLNPDDMNLTNEEYADLKRRIRKQKQLNQQIKNNIKSQQGFGYTYKEISYDV